MPELHRTPRSGPAVAMPSVFDAAFGSRLASAVSRGTEAVIGRGPYIQTLHSVWYPFDPRPEEVDTRDFRALEMIARFGGHTERHYSVLEHSIRVAALLHEQGHDRLIVWQGLTHDAHEIYPPGDFIGPILRAMPETKAMERAAYTAVRKALLWPSAEMDKRVKLADLIMLSAEKKNVVPYVTSCDWGDLPDPDLADEIGDHAPTIGEFSWWWNRYKPDGVGSYSE